MINRTKIISIRRKQVLGGISMNRQTGVSGWNESGNFDLYKVQLVNFLLIVAPVCDRQTISCFVGKQRRNLSNVREQILNRGFRFP